MSPVLLGLVAALAWGCHDFAARFASRSIGALRTVLGVTTAGLAALTVWLALSGAWPVLHPRELWLLALMGAGISLATLWLFEALARGPFTLVSPIVAAYPVTALMFGVAMGTRLLVWQWLAIAGVVAGVLLVAAAAREAAGADGDADGRATNPIGMRFRTILIYAALSNVAFAVSITAGQYAATIYGELQATWLSRLFGLAVIGLAVMRSGTGLEPGAGFRLPLRWLPVLVAMGLLDVTALASVSAAGHGQGAELATVVSSAFGIVAIVLARVFLKEGISPLQWFGIALVFGGGVVLAF